MSAKQALIAISAVIGMVSVGESQAEEGETGARAIEEIIVTAQRRDESLRDVPISVGVVQEDVLFSFGISEVDDLAAIDPSLTVNAASGTAGEGFRIRGIGGSTFADGIEQSVSVLIDEVITGSSGSGLLEFWDIDRIEVLRGPQGTLFGKNASAGVISVHTNDPTDTLSSKLRAEYSPTFDDSRLDFHIGGPIADSLGLRLSGFYANRADGYIDNPVSGTGENEKERWGSRLKGIWKGQSFEVDASIEYFEQDNECCSRTYRSINEDVAATSGLSQLFISRLNANELVPSDEQYTTLTDASITHTNEVLHATLKPSWTFDSGLELRSITGYRDWDQRAITDSDMIDIDVANRLDVKRDMQVFSQEFQLLSPQEAKLKYLVGLYYFRQWFDVDADLQGGSALTGGTTLQTLQETEVDSENYAIFLHVSYAFSEQLEGFIGLRLLRDKISADFVSDGNFFAFPVGSLAGAETSEDSNWTGTIGLKYYLRESMMFYGSVSRGYKGPAIDVSASGVIADPDADPILDPEIVVNYELGARTSWLDNRLQLDATVFYSDVDDFQASAFDSQTSTFVLRNAGKMESSGVELSLAALLTPNLQLNFTGTYTDAKYVDFTGVPCTAPDLVAGTCFNSPAAAPPGAIVGQDLSGEHVNQIPKWALVMGLHYSYTLGRLNGYARFDLSWQDDMVSDLDLDPATTVPSYSIANFELGVYPAERWLVQGWVRNAFDEAYTNRVFDAPAFSGGYAQFLAQPRTAGVTIQYSIDPN